MAFFYTVTIDGVTDTAGNVLEDAPLTIEIVFNNTVAPIAITEFMYNQPSVDTLEFIELYHYGSTPAQLGGYEFDRGINYTFPTMTMLPGEYMVLTMNKAATDAFFGIDAVEWQSGSLNNGGEAIEIVNTSGDMIDFLDYQDGNPWPIESDGMGSSNELCDPSADNSNGLNWQASEYLAGIFLGDSILAKSWSGKLYGDGYRDGFGSCGYRHLSKSVHRHVYCIGRTQSSEKRSCAQSYGANSNRTSTSKWASSYRLRSDA